VVAGKPPDCGVFPRRTKSTIRESAVGRVVSATLPPTATLTDKQRRILHYLRERVDTKTYFKSRLIGEALGLSAREVGTNMNAIQDADFDLCVEKWGYSSSTTWKVTV
jgi:hypothetical protein